MRFGTFLAIELHPPIHELTEMCAHKLTCSGNVPPAHSSQTVWRQTCIERDENLSPGFNYVNVRLMPTLVAGVHG